MDSTISLKLSKSLESHGSRGYSGSLSPTRKERIVDVSSDSYQSGMNKLIDASWKFDREKDSDLLKTLETRELTREQFKEILRGRMQCRLSADEFNSLVPLFDNNGYVDGCEFILYFYHLRYEYRSNLLKERVKRERQIRTAHQMHDVKIKEELELKAQIKLVDDYKPDDLSSAINKLTNAAVKYDRLMPGAVQLDAFECENMKPHEFREQLKLVFNVQLTIPELSAYIKDFNTKHSFVGDNMNCAAFLVNFFRIGFKEKNRRLKSVWEEKKRVQTEREQKKYEDKLEKDQKNFIKVDSNFTPEERARALVKLRNAAKLYDKAMPGAMSLHSFEVAFLLPHEFREQLKRVFNLTVTSAEMGALVDFFDENHDGVITCAEFTKVFLNMGFAEREKDLKESIEKQKKAEEDRKLELEKKQQALESKNALKVSYNYTEEDKQNAYSKLIEAAWRFDKNMPGAPNLEAFERMYMEPHAFKEQLQKAFYMKTTPEELGAVMDYFDPERTGAIHCASFLKKFFKTGYDERQRRSQLWRKHQKELVARKQAKALQAKLDADNKLNLPTDLQYTESDFQSAFSKLTHGAVKYFKSGPGAVGLDGFEVISMLPHVWREQLKLVFNIKLTVNELAALMSYFDKTNSGVINCKDFITKFLRTGYDERDRIRKGWRTEIELKKEKDEKIMIEKELEKQQKAWLEADFDFLESDFDDALTKLIHISHHFDPRLLGPAGFAAFNAAYMNPSEFRETLKRTFNLKVTSKELGAMVNYFDTSGKRVANCSAFLNSFVQIRVQCEEFKGKPDENAKIKEYHGQLKAAYYHKIERQKGVVKDFASRPWLENISKPVSKTFGKVFKPKNASVPTTIIEKYKLRVLIAKRNGRLDLSSKAIWLDVDDILGLNNNDKNVGENEVKMNEDQSSFFITNDDSLLKDEQLSSSLVMNDVNQQNESQNSNNNNETEFLFAPMDPLDAQSSFINFRLLQIPNEVLKMTALTELWLCNNALKTIPTQICELKSLKILSLKGNYLETIPPEVCLLDSLTKLYLNNNKLSVLPSLLLRLKNLKDLNINNNLFEEFPLVITSMTWLIELYMSGNRLSSHMIPMEIHEMKSLSFLDLSNNNINSFPIGLMKSPWINFFSYLKLFMYVTVCNAGADEEALIGLIRRRAQKSVELKKQSEDLSSKLRRRKVK
eukprot:gene6731-9225_t